MGGNTHSFPRVSSQHVKLASISVLTLTTLPYLVHLIKHKLNKTLKDKNGATLPPGPDPLPMVGSLHLMGSDFDDNGNPRIHKHLQRLAAQYGPVFGLYLGAYYTVVVSKPEQAKQVFVTNDRITSDRAPFQSDGGDHVPSMSLATKNGKGVAMSAPNSYWRAVRTLVETNVSRPGVAVRNVPLVQSEVHTNL